MSDKQLEHLVNKYLAKRGEKRKFPKPQWINELIYVQFIVVVFAIAGITIDKYVDLSAPSYGYFLAIGFFLGTIVIKDEKLTLLRLFLCGIGIVTLITQCVIMTSTKV